MRAVRVQIIAALLCWLPASGAARLYAGVHTTLGTQSLPNHALLPPGDCSGCHGDYDAQNNLEPWNTWAGSMMANAARDPIFWAALDVANNDALDPAIDPPGIGEFCLRCHVPWGWLEQRANADDGAPPNGNADGCALGNEQGQQAIDASDNDFEGLICHFCHRMMINENPPEEQLGVYYENANFWIDDGECPAGGTGPCRRGPYTYSGGPGDHEPPGNHPWAYSDYHVDNRICGNCHNVTNPYLLLRDENGDEIQNVYFPIERTYNEWMLSDYSQTGEDFRNCSDCHMPDSTADPAYASNRGSPNRALPDSRLPVHQFAGGNAWIPQVLKGEYGPLGLDASYDATTAWALDQLQSQSATVEVVAPQSVDPGDVMAVDVVVTNQTGHKLPTGYGEGRRMWLHLEARDATDELVWESGAYDPATGVLTHDPQIKVYEVQQGVWNYNGTSSCDVVDDGTGQHIFHFVKNDCIALDNRIPPLGFMGGTDPETRPVGYAYPEDDERPGVLVHWDTTSYDIPVPIDAALPIAVTATLRYQTASKEYIEFLRDEAVDNNFANDCILGTDGSNLGISRGEALYAMWEQYDRSPPVDIDSATAEVLDGSAVFTDDFESGDLSAWSTVVP